jgi:hypothetical protein
MFNKNKYLEVNVHAIQALIGWAPIGVDRMPAAYYRHCMQIAPRWGDQAVDSDGTQTAFNGSNA